MTSPVHFHHSETKRISSAVLSECGRYRYRLSRAWPAVWGTRDEIRYCAFIMLNPSTADAKTDDPTIRKCRGFAKKWGFRGLHVVNLYSYRATNPNDLLAAERAGTNIVGEGNDNWIRHTICSPATERVVCAWGSRASATRCHAVLELLRRMQVTPWAIRLNNNGQPAHPLYIPYAVQPFAWDPHSNGAVSGK